MRKDYMKELLAYTELIKTIIDRYYFKEVVFYNDGEWYSREHSRHITVEELSEWLEEIVKPIYDDNDC